MLQVNMGFFLNIFLLLSILLAAGFFFKMRRSSRELPFLHSDTLDAPPSPEQADDILAIRRVSQEAYETDFPQTKTKKILASRSRLENKMPTLSSSTQKDPGLAAPPSLIVFLLAKEEHLLAGYDLLQTILAAGLRFGEGLFHRYQGANGQGPVLCSLAAATERGIFDLQNIATFHVRGLCIFMEASTDPVVNAARLESFLDTAKQLSEELDTYLLDDQRAPFSEHSLARYRAVLSLPLE